MSYVKHVWTDREFITPEKLNYIEVAIEQTEGENLYLNEKVSLSQLNKNTGNITIVNHGNSTTITLPQFNSNYFNSENYYFSSKLIYDIFNKIILDN